MTNIQPTEAQKAKIEELLTAPYPVTLATAAKALETTEEEAAKLLPEGMARFVTGDASERFDEVWERLGTLPNDSTKSGNASPSGKR